MKTQNFKPILFSTEMVQAILAGRKTQTRRIIKIKTTPFIENLSEESMKKHLESPGAREIYGGYNAGDILWVRETSFEITERLRSFPLFQNYTVDEKFLFKTDSPDIGCHNWKPSIFMPKEAARIFLKVTNVRVERLQDISEVDAIDEGIRKCTLDGCEDLWENYNGFMGFYEAKDSFQSLWQSINAKKHPWESNPWVWVYEFERIEKPENFLS